MRDKSNELEIKIDKEINALKAAVEMTKNETIKCVLCCHAASHAALVPNSQLDS